MTTTIRSTELDFHKIKENLKYFLRQQDEFSDYDFEGAALSNLLDVLAHNTHFNALIANFALNESYLTTAQMRNSVVSLAESLGYIPASKSSAQSTVTVTINLAGIEGLESNYSILPGELVLRGSIDDQDFTFSNRETLLATSNGSGIYSVTPYANPEASVRVYEGQERTESYVVDGTPNAVYVIPDEDIDIATAIVKLYEDQGSAQSASGSYKVFSDVMKATTVTALSRLYILRESPNRFFELTFGDRNSLGETPLAGNVVEINYLRTAGADANGVASLRLQSTLDFGGYEVQASDVSVTVDARSSGGDEKEDIERIRKRAPFQYAAQNRMITALDYEALILRDYSSYIDDIICWGGEEDLKKDYGSVYTSIVWKDNLSSTTIGELRDEIRALTKDLSVAAFQLKFIEPSQTWISSETHYQYNPTLSSKTESTISNQVRTTVNTYFEDNLGKFEQSFRRSNLLTLIDDTDPSILSSRMSVTLQKRIRPILTLEENHTLEYPAALKTPTDTTSPVIRTTYFKYNNKTVYIRNKLTDRVKVSPPGRVPVVFDSQPSTKLEMVDVDGNVVVSNIGSFSPLDGTVTILGLNVQSVLSANNYIKVFATPANESAVAPDYSNILEYDASESSIKSVLVTARN